MDEGPLTVEQLNELIRTEEIQWKRLGIDTRMFAPDLIFLSCQVDAICSILIAREFTTQEEADRILKEKILDTMKELRSNFVRSRIAGRNNGIIKP